MSVHIARAVDDVLDNLSSVSGATVLAGGTDLLVEINFGRVRPTAVVAIDRVAELKNLERNGRVRMGALVTYTRMLDDDPGSPALREAARTVGSPLRRFRPRCLSQSRCCPYPFLAGSSQPATMHGPRGPRRRPGRRGSAGRAFR